GVTVQPQRRLGPNPADETCRIAQSCETLPVVGPLDTERALIEMLAGANSEDHPSWMQDAECAKRLRDDAGVVAERRRVDRGPQGDAGRVLSDRREPREREWCVSIGMPPRLAVVAD